MTEATRFSTSGDTSGVYYSGTVACPAGYVVTGGGVQMDDAAGDHDLDSYPTSSSSWTADVDIQVADDAFIVYAECQQGASVNGIAAGPRQTGAVAVLHGK
jgi:hypothetical protein